MSAIGEKIGAARMSLLGWIGCLLLAMAVASPVFWVYKEVQHEAPIGQVWQGDFGRDEMTHLQYQRYFVNGGRLATTVGDAKSSFGSGYLLMAVDGFIGNKLGFEPIFFHWVLRFCFGVYFLMGALVLFRALLPRHWFGGWLWILFGSGLGWLLVALPLSIPPEKIFGDRNAAWLTYTLDLREGLCGFFSTLVFRFYHCSVMGSMAFTLAFFWRALEEKKQGFLLIAAGFAAFGILTHGITAYYWLLFIGVLALLRLPELWTLPKWSIGMALLLIGVSGVAFVASERRYPELYLASKDCYTFCIRPLAYLISFGPYITLITLVLVRRLRREWGHWDKSLLLHASSWMMLCFLVGAFLIELVGARLMDLVTDRLYIILVAATLLVGILFIFCFKKSGGTLVEPGDVLTLAMIQALIFGTALLINPYYGKAWIFYPGRLSLFIAFLVILLAARLVWENFSKRTASLITCVLLAATIPSSYVTYNYQAHTQPHAPIRGNEQEMVGGLTHCPQQDEEVLVVESDVADGLYPHGTRRVLVDFSDSHTTQREARRQVLADFLSDQTPPQKRRERIEKYHLAWLLWDKRNPEKRPFHPETFVPEFLTPVAECGVWKLYKIESLKPTDKIKPSPEQGTSE